ncbi:MAG: hypothetical protein ACKVTZ_11395 [Bacteroidia bacterium]
MQKQFLVFIFIINSFSVIFAQENTAVHESLQVLLGMKKGAILVVKLPTGAKKMKAIAEDSAHNYKNSSHMQRLAKIKQVEIDKNIKIQKNLMLGLKQFYTYTPFVAVFDCCYDKLLKNNALGNIFYDENLMIKKDFSLNGKSFFTFRSDQDLTGVGNQHVIFVITDKNGQQLRAPFPSQIPYKFRNEPLIDAFSIQIFEKSNTYQDEKYISNSSILQKYRTSKTTNEPTEDYAKRVYSKKMDKNAYFAIAKMLQLKLSNFENFVTQDEFLKKTNN